MTTLAELFVKILQLIEQGDYVLKDRDFNPLHMSEVDRRIHLAEDYLLDLYLTEHSALDKTQVSSIIEVKEIEKSSEAHAVIKSATFKELTYLISPEAEKSTKWAALEHDMSQTALEQQLVKVKQNKQVLSNTNLEINHYGAVYTNHVLVDIMLTQVDKIHKHQNNGVSIFADSSLTICDPASGSGSFLLCAELLLAQEQPTSDETAIVNNQLFGSEIQKKQMLISKKVLNYKNRKTVSPNIHLGDSLSFDFWGRKFGLVIGNPPYQGVMEDGTSRNRHNLWEQFILKGLEITRDDGYLALIVPTSWMSPAWKHMDNTFRRYKLHHLEINTIRKYFPDIGSQFSWFVIQKTKTDENFSTHIVSEFAGERYEFDQVFNKIPFMAQLLSDESVSIMEKFYNYSQTFNFASDSYLHASNKKEYLSNVKDASHPYIIKHTTAQTKYSSIPHQYQTAKKVILCDSGNPKPEYDQGIYGVTQHYFYSFVENDAEGKAKEELLKSKLFQFIFKICKWSGFGILKVFSNLPFPILSSYTDEEIYKALKLTDQEIALIEKVVK